MPRNLEWKNWHFLVHRRVSDERVKILCSSALIHAGKCGKNGWGAGGGVGELYELYIMIISDDERLLCAEAGSVAPDCGRVYAGSGIWTRTRCILRTRCDGMYAPSTVQESVSLCVSTLCERSACTVDGAYISCYITMLHHYHMLQQ